MVTPVYNPPLDVLTKTIKSVQNQTFKNWELILIDDHSPDAAVRGLLHQHAAGDKRIKVIERPTNGHIVAASNDGVAAARGEFIALLDHDDVIVEDALEKMADAISKHPNVGYLYSDEEIIDAKDNIHKPFRKARWSPERLRGQMYTNHFSVLRTDLVRQVGAFREGFDGSQDHDLVLRVTEAADEVVHIPQVLYQWRSVPGSAAESEDAKPYAWEAGRKAVNEHLQRTGVRGHAILGPYIGTYRIVRDPIPADLLVSVIIPTRGEAGVAFGKHRVFIVEAIKSLLEKGGHTNLEFVIVYDPPTPEAVLNELRELLGERLVLVPYDKPFSYSEKCNLGVLYSHGTVILLVNDDIEAISDNLIGKLVAPLLEPGVGQTGAMLLFEDGTIQHAGVQVIETLLTHAYIGDDPNEPVHLYDTSIDREVLAVTAALTAIKRVTFDAVGGFSELLPINYNDVDLSLKIGTLGLRRLWIADAVAYHFESKSRKVGIPSTWEIELIKRRWEMPFYDPYLPGVRRHSFESEWALVKEYFKAGGVSEVFRRASGRIRKVVRRRLGRFPKA